MVEKSDRYKDKLTELDERIRAAETMPERDLRFSESEAAKQTSVSARRIGFDFLASVLVCVGIGVILDVTVGKNALFIPLMLIIGFMVGLFNVWRALNGYGHAIGFRKRGNGNGS